LLVAPIAPGTKSRTVVLPKGKWFDFYTGRLVGEGQTVVELTPPLSQIPLLVRDGSLVPLVGERQWAPGPDEVLPLEVRHYGLRPAVMDLYDDDGETFDYERGEHSWTRLEVARDGAGRWRGTRPSRHAPTRLSRERRKSGSARATGAAVGCAWSGCASRARMAGSSSPSCRTRSG
jgi:alpha-glucosidase (family GH31 glycosyl hydrolase)